jgi:hypothetical protein
MMDHTRPITTSVVWVERESGPVQFTVMSHSYDHTVIKYYTYNPGEILGNMI